MPPRGVEQEDLVTNGETFELDKAVVLRLLRERHCVSFQVFRSPSPLLLLSFLALIIPTVAQSAPVQKAPAWARR